MPLRALPRPPLRPVLAALFGAGLAACAARPDAALQHVSLAEVGRLPAFSHATVAGDLVFVSGTLGTKPGSTELVPGGVAAETAQILRNVEAILTASGSALSGIARCTVYLVDLRDFAAMNEVWNATLPEPRPARATVGVASLVLGARVEVECTALRLR